MASPVVRISQGQLRGGRRKNLDGDEFFSFLGIPYAKPPIGELRFKAPQPAEPWTGIRDATIEGDCCYSRNDITQALEGSEDCLNLNVFTKELPQTNNKLKAVMVWIHGGGFIYGSNRTSIYGPEFLMLEDIVLVTINYRLGLVGFLSLEDTSLGVPGNAGLKDQVLALKWVQQNIKKFNGDPNNVTIFGESAGSSAVHFHVISDASKGLFHRAILQSGSALNFWAFGRSVGKQSAKCLGYDIEDEKEILEILKKTPVEKLHEAQEKIEGFPVASKPRLLCAVMEKQNETAFLTDKAVIDIITSGKYNKVPMMFGYTSREGIFMTLMGSSIGKGVLEHHKPEPKKLENFIPWQVHLESGTEKSNLICKKMKDVYFKSEDDVDNGIVLETDSWFFPGIMASVKNHVATSGKPVYLYRMSLSAGLNYIKNLGNLQHLRGASHADDLGYLFTNAITPEVKPGSLEDISVRRFVKLWTNFAKYGNPTPDKKELGITWEPVTKGKTNFLDIGEQLTMEVDPEPERLSLWREIYHLHPDTEKYL